VNRPFRGHCPRRALRVAVGAGVCSLLVAGLVLGRPLLTGPNDRPGGPPPDHLPGQTGFVAGVNYPWKTGQDFGTGAWGHSGVSNATTYQEVDADFALLAAQGVRVVKWRVFGDGRYSPEFDQSGTVTGLDDAFFADLDAALEIAARHDVKLVLTLFASGLWTADCRTNGVEMGGHAATIVDPVKRKAMIDRAIVPMLRHLAHSDRVIAFEIIAEPDWGIAELNTDDDGRTKIPLAAARSFVRDVATAVHRETRALATVEANRGTNMRRWTGLGLDYYSFSWYDWLEPYEPLATPVGALGLDRPVVLGEFPSSGSRYYTLPDVLDAMGGGGYAGAFAWSYWSGDGFGSWHDAGPAFAAWQSAREPAAGTPSPLAAVPVDPAYPYSYRDVSLRLDNGALLVGAAVKVASGEPFIAHAYLYELGSSQAVEEETMTASPTQPGTMSARFSSVTPGTPYRVSLGLFSPSYSPLKWFNELATFAVGPDGIARPTVEPQIAEQNCRP